MTVREYFRHQMKAHKDCVITVNNADMNTINALTNSNSTGLAVNVIDNKIDLDTLEDHCKESSEFISCIILPDDIENIEAVSNIVHKYNIKVIKIASYEDFLSETPLAEQGVDVIAFGPVATTHELHNTCWTQTRQHMIFRFECIVAYNRKSIEICKLLEIDNANI